MAQKKSDLLKKAQAQNLDVNESNTVAEIKDALNNNSNTTNNDEHPSAPEEVTVNENENQEAVNGTTSDSESEVTNTDSIPQNGITEIKTTEPENKIAERADAARTEGEIKFADESNPNQKARTKGAQDEVDADGNERTGGKSYGVAEDDPNVAAPRNTKEGASDLPSSSSPSVEPYKQEETVPGQLLHGDTNSQEYTVEDQQSLEDELGDSSNGISARVLVSAGDYVKVKFFKNNLVFGIYKSKNFDKSKAVEFRDSLLEQQS